MVKDSVSGRVAHAFSRTRNRGKKKKLHLERKSKRTFGTAESKRGGDKKRVGPKKGSLGLIRGVNGRGAQATFLGQCDGDRRRRKGEIARTEVR